MSAKYLPSKFNFLKKKRVLFFLLTGIAFLLIHSCMNFRTSDRKTRKEFEKAGVESTIRHLKIPGADAEVRMISTGKDTTRTVLFIHGAPGSGDAFYSYLKQPSLLEKATLITYDRPGYGYSGFGEAVTSIKKQSEVLVELIEKNQLKNVVLVAHSYGGPIAAYAALLSGKIEAVILLAPAMDPNHEKYFWIGNLARWKLTRWMVPGAWTVAADEKYTHEEELRKLTSEWKKVAAPVICIQGDEDRLVPFANMAFCREHFNPEYFTGIPLKGEDHFIPWTREALVIEEIVKVLK